jgi:8-oxo-dGTP pyrophosphatase MutT (NUDIX family)
MSRFVSYGGAVLDERSRILLREVSRHHKGYVWTLPKGRLDPGDTPEQTALREVREEAGVEAEIVGEIPGVFSGLESETRYFLMRFVHDHGDHDDETSRVGWFDFAEAEQLLGLTTHATGRERDLAVLRAVASMC